MRDVSRCAICRERVFRDRNNVLIIYIDGHEEERFAYFNYGKKTSPVIPDEANRGIQNCKFSWHYDLMPQAAFKMSLVIYMGFMYLQPERISSFIARRKGDFIKFPSVANIGKVKQDFYEIAGFPGGCGAIDCTHMGIQAPNKNKAAFINRKRFYSINVQAICNAHYEITNIVARWPGSTHDSRIFDISTIKEKLANG